MKKAVIFDLDGTLNDTIASIKKSADEVMKRCGFGPYSEEQYKRFVGDGAAVLVERCLEAGGDTEHARFEEAYAEYRKVFEKYCMYQVRPYSGIRELLEELQKRDVRLAVLSNKPHLRTVEVIEAVFGKDCFDIVLGQTEGLRRKPAPDGVFYILERLGLKAGDVLYLGDTGTDMQTGKSAGVFCVGALWGFRDRAELEENHADAVIASPLELLAYL